MTEIQVGLTHKERQLWTAFQAHLNSTNKKKFTTDDLLEYFSEDRLKEVFKDPTHDKGIFFFKLLRLGEIRKVGRTYGRYHREIKQYEVP